MCRDIWLGRWQCCPSVYKSSYFYRHQTSFTSNLFPASAVFFPVPSLRDLSVNLAARSTYHEVPVDTGSFRAKLDAKYTSSVRLYIVSSRSRYVDLMDETVDNSLHLAAACIKNCRGKMTVKSKFWLKYNSLCSLDGEIKMHNHKDCITWCQINVHANQ